jgi:hypothetical protein
MHREFHKDSKKYSFAILRFSTIYYELCKIQPFIHKRKRKTALCDTIHVLAQTHCLTGGKHLECYTEHFHLKKIQQSHQLNIWSILQITTLPMGCTARVFLEATAGNQITTLVHATFRVCLDDVVFENCSIINLWFYKPERHKTMV